MIDHTWISPVGKKGTIEYHGRVLHMHIYTDVAGYDDESFPIIVTGRLCALSRLVGNGVKFRVKRSQIEAEPDGWHPE